MAAPALTAPWNSADLYKIWAALTAGIPVVLPNPLPVSVSNFATLVSLMDADNAGAGVKVLPQWSSMVNALNGNANGYPVRNPAGVPIEVTSMSGSVVNNTMVNFNQANVDLLNTSAVIAMTVHADNTGFNVNNFLTGLISVSQAVANNRLYTRNREPSNGVVQTAFTSVTTFAALVAAVNAYLAGSANKYLGFDWEFGELAGVPTWWGIVAETTT